VDDVTEGTPGSRQPDNSGIWAAPGSPVAPANPLGPFWGDASVGMSGSSFGPGDPTAPGQAWVRAGDLWAGAACFGGMLVAGPLLGLLWAATAPRISVRDVLGGSEAAFDAQGGVDMYYLMIFLVGGIIGGVLAFWRGRDAGWPVPVGLALGGIAGSVLGGVVGHALRSGSVRSQIPSGTSSLAVQLVDFRVRSHGLYAAMPTAALFVLVILLWLAVRTGRPESSG
jgi:hypothetical protein